MSRIEDAAHCLAQHDHMNYAAVVVRLFGRNPTTVTTTPVADPGSLVAMAERESVTHLSEFGDYPRALAELSTGQFVAIGRTHAVMHGDGSVEVERLSEADRAEEPDEPAAFVRDLTPVEKKNAREHVKAGRKLYRFGKFRPGMSVSWSGSKWIVYDARARGGTKFTLMLVSPDYERMADEVQPAQIGEDVAESRWDALARLDESFKIATRYTALGIPEPNPATMCLGQCEGAGVVPVQRDEQDAELQRRWSVAEQEHPSEDGWHFVKCPTCEGSRKAKVESQQSAVKSGYVTDITKVARPRGESCGTCNHSYALDDISRQNSGSFRVECEKFKFVANSRGHCSKWQERGSHESVDEAKGARLVAFRDLGDSANPQYVAVMDFGQHGFASYPVYGDTYQPRGSRHFVAVSDVTLGNNEAGKNRTAWFRGLSRSGSEWARAVTAELSGVSRQSRDYRESVDEAVPTLRVGRFYALRNGAGSQDPDAIIFVTTEQKNGAKAGLHYDVARNKTTRQSFSGFNLTGMTEVTRAELDGTAKANMARHLGGKSFEDFAESVDESRLGIGDHVKIHYKTPRGEVENAFQGQVGTISSTEKDGRTTMFRVKFSPPVKVPGVDPVTSDLWAAEFLKPARSESVDEAGKWRTTKSGHKIFIDGGKVTKGNPHVVRSSADSSEDDSYGKPKQPVLNPTHGGPPDHSHRRGSDRNIPDSFYKEHGLKPQPVPKKGKPLGWKATPDGPEVIGYASRGRYLFALVRTPGTNTIGRLTAGRVKESTDEARKSKHAYGVGDRVDVKGEGRGEIVRLRHDSQNAYEVRFDKGGTKVVWDNPEGAAVVGFRKITKVESVDEMRMEAGFSYEGKTVMVMRDKTNFSFVVNGEQIEDGFTSRAAALKAAKAHIDQMLATSESVAEGAYGKDIEAKDVTRSGSKEKMWLVLRFGIPIGFVTKFRDTRTDTNPWKAFHYDKPQGVTVGGAHAAGGDKSNTSLGFTYRGGLKAAVQAVVANQKLVQDTPESVDESKAVPDIASPIYRDVAKLPKYNVKVSPLSAHGSDGGKLLARRLPDWTKADHLSAGAEHERTAAEMEKQWSVEANKAAQGTWGRDYKPSDYRISGIASDEFSDAHKEELRRLAHTATAHKEAAHAHKMAARMRSLAKEDLDEAGPAAPLFTSADSNDFIEALRKTLTAPFVEVLRGPLWGDASGPKVSITLSLDAKDSWANGILQNSRYAKFFVDPNGTVEQITKSYKVAKFRKAVAKSSVDVASKLNAWAKSADESTEVVRVDSFSDLTHDHTPIDPDSLTGRALVGEFGTLDEGVKDKTVGSLFIALQTTVVKKTSHLPNTAPVLTQVLDMLGKVATAIKGHESKSGDAGLRIFVQAARKAGFMTNFGAPLTTISKLPGMQHDTISGKLYMPDENPRKDESVDEAKALTISTKDPATMTPAEINREKDKLSKASSALTDKFIEIGRGHWLQSDIRAEAEKGDDLSKQNVAITRRQQDLSVEIELRYGPNAPSRLPLRRGFGPRKKADESVDEASENATSVADIENALADLGYKPDPSSRGSAGWKSFKHPKTGHGVAVGLRQGKPVFSARGPSGYDHETNDLVVLRNLATKWAAKNESVDEMARLSAGGRSELMRASKETNSPDDESVDWRRVTRAWMDDGKVLEKRDVNFKATGEAAYQKARKHSYGWKVAGKVKADLLADPVKLTAALESTRDKLAAAGWAIESFTPPQ